MKTTYETCDGFHGISHIEVDDSRIVELEGNEWVCGGRFAWLTPAEMAANKPCGMSGCVCGDGFTIRDSRDGGYGDCLVFLR